MAFKKPGPRSKRPSYKLADGKRAPSVTTILGVLDKPGLDRWRVKMALTPSGDVNAARADLVSDTVRGVSRDISKAIDTLLAAARGTDPYDNMDAADAGTITHAAIEADLGFRDEAPAEMRERPEAVIAEAKLAYSRWRSWRTDHDIVPVMMEGMLVSEHYRIGGTFDFYGWIDGRLEVADFKTTGGIYPESFVQLAAYRAMLEEHGYPVEGVRIIRLSRDADAMIPYEDQGRDDSGEDLGIFRACYLLYEWQRIAENARRREQRARVAATSD